MPTVYDLWWHENGFDEASDRFYRYYGDPPETLYQHEFDQLYREIGEVETYDLEELYAEWKRGSGRESHETAKAKGASIRTQEELYHILSGAGKCESERTPIQSE